MKGAGQELTRIAFSKDSASLEITFRCARIWAMNSYDFKMGFGLQLI